MGWSLGSEWRNLDNARRWSVEIEIVRLDARQRKLDLGILNISRAGTRGVWRIQLIRYKEKIV